MLLNNLNSLKMFDAAARHLNFRLAAQELNLTQGAVAQQVRALEARLSAPLFHRRPRGLELTDSGQEYHQQICKALKIIDTATVKLLRRRDRVTLSVTPSFASKWLVPRLAKFALEHPGIDLHTIASGKLSDLITDSVDIAIRIGGAPFDSKLEVMPFSSINLCAVCSPEFSAEVTTITSPLDFLKQQLIQDGHFHWDHLLEISSDVNPTKILQFNQTSLAIDAAINGQGIALSPLILVEEDIANGKLVKLWLSESTDQGDNYYLLSLKSDLESPSKEKVIQWLFKMTRDYY